VTTFNVKTPPLSVGFLLFTVQKFTLEKQQMIRLKNVYKSFNTCDGKPVGAIKNISLEVNAGEIFGLIGFSGAGKSTLLRLINLLERPDSGQVIVDGADLMQLSPPQLRRARQNIGMVFQQFNLLANRTVEGNVAFALEVAGWHKSIIQKRVAECLAIVQLSDRAQYYPSQLSGGQKQRVGIARAIASHPHVILADEPTSALDPTTTQSLLTCLAEINRSFGVTIVIVSHEMSVVRSICQRAAVVEAGEITEFIAIKDGENAAQTVLAKALWEK
jgi:D-methionine transport system ATP-binding protein